MWVLLIGSQSDNNIPQKYKYNSVAQFANISVTLGVHVILIKKLILFNTIYSFSEQVQGITIFSIIALFLTLMVFFGRLCFGWFKGFSPITYKVRNSIPRELWALSVFICSSSIISIYRPWYQMMDQHLAFVCESSSIHFLARLY